MIFSKKIIVAVCAGMLIGIPILYLVGSVFFQDDPEDGDPEELPGEIAIEFETDSEE